eukprot:6490088-Amphidinium_carterae.2
MSKLVASTDVSPHNPTDALSQHEPTKQDRGRYNRNCIPLTCCVRDAATIDRFTIMSSVCLTTVVIDVGTSLHPADRRWQHAARDCSEDGGVH